MHENTLISARHLHDMMDSLPVVVIDTRPPKVYERGHIPGAVNVHDIFTYLATPHRRGSRSCGRSSPRPSARRDWGARRWR